MKLMALSAAIKIYPPAHLHGMKKMTLCLLPLYIFTDLLQDLMFHSGDE